MIQKNNQWKFPLLFSSLLATIIAICVLYITWQHNPQGEFHSSSEGVHWQNWLSYGAIYFAASFLLFFPSIQLIFWIKQK